MTGTRALGLAAPRALDCGHSCGGRTVKHAWMLALALCWGCGEPGNVGPNGSGSGGSSDMGGTGITGGTATTSDSGDSSSLSQAPQGQIIDVRDRYGEPQPNVPVVVNDASGAV